MLGVRYKSMATLLAHNLGRLQAEGKSVKVVTHGELTEGISGTTPEPVFLDYHEESHDIDVIPTPARAERQRHKTQSRKKKAFRP